MAVARLADQSLVGRGGAEEASLRPYAMRVRIQGIARILFHRYDPQKAEDDSKRPKGSKKKDDVESYLYRDADGFLVIPALNVKACLLEAAKWFHDPRSSGRKKQAKGLFAAAILVEPELCPLYVNGKRVREPQFIDRRGVVIKHSGRVNRERPGLLPGWECEFEVHVLAPEYIPPEFLREVLGTAGRFVGLGDFRPDFGRFQIVSAVVQG